MIKVDRYGCKYIAAPKGKVLRAYMLDSWGFIEHCLVDAYGGVFARGHGGWRHDQASGHYRLVVLPNPVERGNEWNNSSWRWEDWYERNWLCDSWAWIYMKVAPFRDLEELKAA